MDLERLLAYFDTSAAVRLLRSTNAPFIIDFLNREFKQKGALAITHSDLRSELSTYQEELHETYPDRLPGPPDEYLATWSSADCLWLRRFLHAQHDEPVYQLTPATEDVLSFLQRLIANELTFVGTESRLKLVIDTLADIVVKASDDPEQRLAHLRAERDRINESMASIQSEGKAEKY